MVNEQFFVTNDERMCKVKTFIRLNMPTARFESNPYKHTSGRWEFNVSYDLSDMNKLSVLLNSFYDEDNQQVMKVSFCSRLTNLVKFFTK